MSVNLLRAKTAVLFAGMLVAGSVFTACESSKNSEGEDILKPIAENVIGKWEHSVSYKKVGDKWEEKVSEPGMAQTATFRADGTALVANTDSLGMTSLMLRTWVANDDSCKFTMGTTPFEVVKLTADEFIIANHIAMEAETKDTLRGDFKWLEKRIVNPQPTMAEKLVGKWNYVKTYEKKNGSWVETSVGVPDESYFDYKETGKVESYSRKGDNERSVELFWSINNKTGKLDCSKDGRTMSSNLTFDDDNSYSITYNDNNDPVTGAVIKGEFKDVYVRD